MEVLNINSNKGTLTVKWSNADLLAYYTTLQRGCYFDNIDNVNWALDSKFTPLHKKHFHKQNQELWSEKECRSVFDIKEGAKIIDIGCGSAVVDLLLYSYIPNSTFYLVDKEGEWPDGLTPLEVFYTEDHPFYHSWKIIEDAITTSQFDRTRFNFLNPISEFPEDVDLIMSSASWCFHYSKDQYWDRVMSSLKTGGKLFLDVRLLPDRDIIGEISEALKSKPNMVEIPQLPTYLDVPPDVDPNTVGYSCLWVKN
jgi:SAM-dependent methyltransferase